ncbi:hypothetical protein D3C75_833050 [compost metagenome]
MGVVGWIGDNFQHDSLLSFLFGRHLPAVKRLGGSYARVDRPVERKKDRRTRACPHAQPPLRQSECTFFQFRPVKAVSLMCNDTPRLERCHSSHNGKKATGVCLGNGLHGRGQICFMPHFSSACTGLFAGKPAPTGTVQVLKTVVILWERVYPRKGRYRRKQNRGSGLCLRQHSRKDHPCFVQAT